MATMSQGDRATRRSAHHRAYTKVISVSPTVVSVTSPAHGAIGVEGDPHPPTECGQTARNDLCAEFERPNHTCPRLIMGANQCHHASDAVLLCQPTQTGS